MNGTEEPSGASMEVGVTEEMYRSEILWSEYFTKK